jgi:Uma2 family endonuclease
MYDLEYLFLFGVPSNKLEIIHSKSRWVFPFTDRQQAESQYDAWLMALCRWKGLPVPTIRKEGAVWQAELDPIEFELYPRPIRALLPINITAFRALYDTFARRDFWPAQPPAMEAGWDPMLDVQDVGMQLYQLFDSIAHDVSGLSSSRVAIALSDTAAVEPDAYVFTASRAECMIQGDYFRGPPALIAEVLTPPSRAWDRGERMDLYRRHGIAHLWLVDPLLETVESFSLQSGAYAPTGVYRPGQSLRPAITPDREVPVASLFETQRRRHRDRVGKEEMTGDAPPPIPEWLVPPDQELGLEYLFLLGHPERRWEIWDNRCPCVLAFGSPVEARHRFRHFLDEACRWEQSATPSAGDEAEVGRFRLRRDGRRIHLDVRVDGRKYRDLLGMWSDRSAWDWGERD